MKLKILLTLVLALSAPIAATAAPHRDPALSQRLSDALGGKSWAEKVQAFGTVKLVTYNCDQCRDGGFMFIDGQSNLVTMRFMFGILDAKIQNNPAIKAQHSQVLLSRGGVRYQNVTRTSDGGQRFLFTQLVSECEACEPFSSVRFAFDFKPNGTFNREHFLGFASAKAGYIGTPPPMEE